MIFMTKFRDDYLSDMKGCSILDVGSQLITEQSMTYRQIFGDDYEYVGMDLEPGNNVDIVGFDALKGKEFDVVISGQVMEHVLRPWEWLKSLVPFYKKYICIIAPHTFHEHRYPLDTYRYFPDGMRDLFDYAGIKEVEIYRGKADTVGIGTK